MALTQVADLLFRYNCVQFAGLFVLRTLQMLIARKDGSGLKVDVPDFQSEDLQVCWGFVLFVYLVTKF